MLIHGTFCSWWNHVHHMSTQETEKCNLHNKMSLNCCGVCIPISKVVVFVSWQGPLDALASQTSWRTEPLRRGGKNMMWRAKRRYLQDKEQPQRDNECEQSERFIHPAVVLSWGYHAYARHHKQTAAWATPDRLHSFNLQIPLACFKGRSVLFCQCHRGYLYIQCNWR